MAHHGGQIRVRLEGGDEVAVDAPRRRGPCVAGDRVSLSLDQDPPRLLEILARSNLLARPAYRGRERPIAANVDRIVAVVAARPTLDPDLLDRCLVVAAHCGIEPLVVCNKRDLLADDAAEHALLDEYRAAGYAVLMTDAREPGGVSEPAAALAGHLRRGHVFRLFLRGGLGGGLRLHGLPFHRG